MPFPSHLRDGPSPQQAPHPAPPTIRQPQQRAGARAQHVSTRSRPHARLQGFTKKITLPKDWYGGFIKEYDGVTLMEFVIHPGINYTRLAQTVLKQRSALQARLRSISNSHVIHPPLTKPGEEFTPRDPSDIAGALPATHPRCPAAHEPSTDRRRPRVTRFTSVTHLCMQLYKQP